MKNVLVVAIALLFVSVAGFAETPTKAPLPAEDLAMILGETAPGGACGALGAAQAGVPTPHFMTTTCTVTCPSGNVSCMSAGTCTAVDRNCVSSLEPGHVTCDGVTTYCPTPCCTGTFRQQECCACNITGDCVDCCVCHGGTIGHCSISCSGGF
jgi:hypothetical protein